MHPGSNATRIAIVGAGHVGTTFAYTLLWSGLAAEILLIDADPRRAEGEAMDLNHAIPFTRPTRIRAANLAACEGAAIIVIAAGAAQKPGETRLELLRRNTELVRAMVPGLAARNPHAVMLIATNPVDVLTYEAWKVSGLPSRRVIGSGTVLDTARLRFLLGERYGVDPRNVHAFIVGEHGDSEVALWSRAHIAGMPIGEQHEDIFRQTRDAAYHIIERKGATYYAVAAGLLRIVESIVRDQHSVLTVSTLIDGLYGIHDVCLSLPAVLGRGGVERLLELELAADELRALQRSADVLRKARQSS